LTRNCRIEDLDKKNLYNFRRAMIGDLSVRETDTLIAGTKAIQKVVFY